MLFVYLVPGLHIYHMQVVAEQGAYLVHTGEDAIHSLLRSVLLLRQLHCVSLQSECRNAGIPGEYEETEQSCDRQSDTRRAGEASSCMGNALALTSR